MTHKLLRELDEEYKQKRAAVIANNYNDIVGEVHEFFQMNVINQFIKIDVIEITKFDYMTNLYTEGDKHLLVNFLCENNLLNKFKVVINSDSNYCQFNTEKYALNEINFSVKSIEIFSRLCLGVFRRGYDKPEQA